MAGDIDRRPAAETDLIEIWLHIARDDEGAADRVLDRIEQTLRMLAARPLLGRARSDLAPGLRSFPIGSRIAFYRPTERGIDLVRVLGGAMDIQPRDVD